MKFVVKFIFWVYILLALFMSNGDVLCFDFAESRKDREKRLFLSRVENLIFYTYPSICLFFIFEYYFPFLSKLFSDMLPTILIVIWGILIWMVHKRFSKEVLLSVILLFGILSIRQTFGFGIIQWINNLPQSIYFILKIGVIIGAIRFSYPIVAEKLFLIKHSLIENTVGRPHLRLYYFVLSPFFLSLCRAIF